MGVGGGEWHVHLAADDPSIQVPARTPRERLSAAFLNCARLRAPIAERLSKFYLHRS